MGRDLTWIRVDANVVMPIHIPPNLPRGQDAARREASLPVEKSALLVYAACIQKSAWVDWTLQLQLAEWPDIGRCISS